MSDAAHTTLVPKAILIEFLYTNGLRYWFLLPIAAWAQGDGAAQTETVLFNAGDAGLPEAGDELSGRKAVRRSEPVEA